MLDEREAILMAHALGVHAEHEDLPTKLPVTPYRNRFSATPGSTDDAVWCAIFARAFASRTTSERMNEYRVTADGMRALRMFYARDAVGAKLIAHASYFIQNEPEGPEDLALWWKPNAHGYTTRIDEAGIYTGWDAVALATNPERRDRIWPVELVREAAFKCVTRDLLDDLVGGYLIRDGKRVPS